MSRYKRILEQIQEKVDFSAEDGELFLDSLIGDTDMDDWELVETREYDESNTSVDEWIKSYNELALAEIIKQDANAKSTLDKNEFKVRYIYQEKHSSTNSRDFCKKMMARTSSGVRYRHEDIVQASFRGVNKSHGHKGKPYSLFKYKGGVNCGHYWEEQLYKLKVTRGGEFVPDNGLASSDEISSASTWYTPKPNGYQESRVAPKDMPRNGHHPDY